jgi:CRISPR-associated exonuclease Cas4
VIGSVSSFWPWAIGAVGLLVLVAAAAALARRASDRRVRGRLVAADSRAAANRYPLSTLVSRRHRLAGRPDELRALSDGRVYPVELKSRGTPFAGPPRSHVVQVAAYCLLVEETTGRPPPFGTIRYSDGGEFRVPWNDATRGSLLALRAELDRPYDGRARPGVARCRRCRWRAGCDARVG